MDASCYGMEIFGMQAGIALGNIAGVLDVRTQEAGIVSELKAGSEEAFAWLIGKYHQPIYSLVARLIPDDADAADLTQEIFIKIYRGIGSFHGDASLRTWIYRIALREASNQRRWWGRHKRQELTIETEFGNSWDGEPICLKDTLVDGQDSPFDRVAQAELRARVETELRAIPEPFQTVVVLRDIEGFSYEEVAEILAVNLGTVKSRLMRGRAHLKEQLAGFAESLAKRPSAGCLLTGASGKERQGGQVNQCVQYREQFSAYLDGAVSGATMHENARHLEGCPDCTTEFTQWRQTQALVQSVGPAKAPANLDLRLRVALSQQTANTAWEKFSRGRLRWENTVRPLVWQFSAGLASTVALLGGVALLIGMVASPEPLLARDEPLGMATNPRFLYTTLETPDKVGDRENPVIVQAFINGEGHVYDYAIVSGNVDSRTRAAVEDMLVFRVFAPAQVFGQPVRGTVVLSFSGVSVRG